MLLKPVQGLKYIDRHLHHNTEIGNKCLKTGVIQILGKNISKSKLYS